MDDPLDQLFVEGNSFDRALLAAIVQPRAQIFQDRGTFQIRFTLAGDQLKVREKILIYLLARKALALKDATNQTVESTSPQEIEKATGIGGGTLRPTLRKLLDEKLLVQNENGAYSVPNYALNSISKLLPPKG